MPVAKNRIMKLGTPRLDLNPGVYPAIIVGMVYPKEPDGKCSYTRGEYLLQVHQGRGVCYVATRPFDVSINADSPLYTLLSGLTGTSSPDQLYDWLEKEGYFRDDTFDECDFLGVSLNAVIERRSRANGQTYNIVSGFAPVPDSSAPELNVHRLIPYSFGLPSKYEIVKLDELDIDRA